MNNKTVVLTIVTFLWLAFLNYRNQKFNHYRKTIIDYKQQLDFLFQSEKEIKEQNYSEDKKQFKRIFNFLILVFLLYGLILFLYYLYDATLPIKSKKYFVLSETKEARIQELQNEINDLRSQYVHLRPLKKDKKRFDFLEMEVQMYARKIDSLRAKCEMFKEKIKEIDLNSKSQALAQIKQMHNKEQRKLAVLEERASRFSYICNYENYDDKKLKDKIFFQEKMEKIKLETQKLEKDENFFQEKMKKIKLETQKLEADGNQIIKKCDDLQKKCKDLEEKNLQIQREVEMYEGKCKEIIFFDNNNKKKSDFNQMRFEIEDEL